MSDHELPQVIQDALKQAPTPIHIYGLFGVLGTAFTAVLTMVRRLGKRLDRSQLEQLNLLKNLREQDRVRIVALEGQLTEAAERADKHQQERAAHIERFVTSIGSVTDAVRNTERSNLTLLESVRSIHSDTRENQRILIELQARGGR